MKKYSLRGGIVGLVVTTIMLVIVELLTECGGYCSGSRLPDRAFLVDAFLIYGLFLIVGIIVGIILGWMIGKVRSKKN